MISPAPAAARPVHLMADYVLESRVRLARPRAEVFAFFADPASLALLTPPAFRLRLLTALPALHAGAVLDLRLVWLGVPVRWRAFIREFDPPYRFVDVQVRGPYARWEHRHRFLADGDGTWVEDRVTYRLPGGLLGRVAHALVVRRQLAALWAYRRRRLGELLGPVSPRPGA
jgi:ligand-binding SRPBCC domain-containing protein